MDLLQQGVDVLLHGVAVSGSVPAAGQKWVNAPRRAAAEYEGHPGPAIVLRCRRRLLSQSFGEQASYATQKAARSRPDATCCHPGATCTTDLREEMCWCGGRLVPLALSLRMTCSLGSKPY